MMRYIKKIAVVLLVALQTSVALAQPHTAAEKDSSRSTRLAGVDSLTLAYYQRKQELLQATLKMLDSTQALHHLQFKIGQQSQPDLTIPDSIRLQDDVRRYDYIGEQLKRDQIDLGPVLDFGKALRAADALINKKKRKTPKMKNLPLPTPLEVDVLSVLWARGASTGPELFAELDSSMLVTMTAEMFWDSLHDMARRGFVSEEIVSPQLTMNFAVGPVLVPVEMSSKNRKNRVYEYQPLIASDDMFSYLLAKNYLARAKNKISTNGKSRLTEKLLAKMLSNRRKTEQAYSENP